MYRATEEKKENDPQENKTTKAIMKNGKRCFERGKIQTRRGRGLKIEEYEVAAGGCP